MNKKVLFTATVDSHILLFHLPYLEYFKKLGYEVHVATNSDKEIPYCDKKIKIPFERSPYRFENFKAIFLLKKNIKQNQYDIIHTHTPMGSVVTRLAAKGARKQCGTKVIYTAHGFHFYKGAPKLNWFLFYPIERYLSKHTDTLITINKEDYLLATKKFKKTNVVYIEGVGLNHEKFKETISEKEALEFRASFGLTKDDFVVTYVAELSKRKNQEMLIKAMETIIKQHKNAHVLLPGSDSMNGFHKRLANELGISKNVHFLGFRKDVVKLLQITNLVVSTSKQEGLPVNILEAMYLGLPVIATDCRGNRDLIQNNENGHIIEIDNCVEFQETFEKIYQSISVKQQKLSSFFNNEPIINNYMLKNVMNQMDKLYQKVLKKKVLHLLASNQYSGAENVACTIIQNCEYEGAYCSPDGDIRKTLKSKNVKYIPIKKMRRSYLKQIIKSYHPDIIHAHDYRASILAAITFHGRIISHLHDNCPFAKNWNLKTILYALTIRKYDKVVAVSNQIYNESIFRNYMKDKYIRIYNYLDKDVILKQATESNKKQYDIYFIGRLSEQKNPIFFIQIVKQIQQILPNIQVVMIGVGEQYTLCQEEIEKKNLQMNIDMVGFQQNPFSIIKNTKIGIMPSNWEGFGLTAIEGMILNKPVLNSGVGGLGEIFKNVPDLICNPEDYVPKIVKLLNDKHYYQKIVNDSQSIVDSYTNLENWQENIKKIYS